MNRRTSAWAGTRRGTKALSLLLSLVLCLNLLPAEVLAAQTGSTDAGRTVFDALGFSTKAPEGYEQDESLAGTPYGKTYTTMAEVDELFTFEPYRVSEAKRDTTYHSLYGHDNALQGSVSGTLSNPEQGPVTIKGNINGSITLQVEGNFSRDNQGQKKNVAFINMNYVTVDKDIRNKVATDKGALVNFDLGVMDPRTGQSDVFYCATQYAKDFDTSVVASSMLHKYDAVPLYLGNSGDKNEKKYNDASTSDEATLEFNAAYTAQNYIELATGDFDGDSIDEIAVYIG